MSTHLKGIAVIDRSSIDNPMNSAITLFARGLSRDSLYETRRWECCEGSEGLTRSEAEELVREWSAQERADYGRVVTEYTIRTAD